jgi:hypothetical protein
MACSSFHSEIYSISWHAQAFILKYTLSHGMLKLSF